MFARFKLCRYKLALRLFGMLATETEAETETETGIKTKTKAKRLDC